MKKKDYNNYFDEIELSKKESNIIKDNILNNKNSKKTLKPVYLLLIITLVVGLGITPVAATVINNSIMVYDKGHSPKLDDNNPDWDKSTYSDTKIDKEYPYNLVTKNEIYTIEQLEELLDIKLLRNNKIMMSNLRIDKLETNNELISHISLINTEKNDNYILNTKKSIHDEIAYTVHIYTTADKTKEHILGGYIASNTTTKEYYIKSLNTTATIIYNDVEDKSHPNDNKYTPSLFLVSFEYQNILYGLDIDGWNYNKNGITMDDIIKILDDFYIK